MSYDIYCIGNAIVDHEFEVSEAFLTKHELTKGTMTLVSEETFAQFTALLKDYYIYQSCGGSAANTAHTCALAGLSVYYQGLVSVDSAGKLFHQSLLNANIKSNITEGPLPIGHTAQCLVLITEDHERTLITCPGIVEELGEELLCVSQIADSSCVYAESYLLAAPRTNQSLFYLRDFARARQIPFALSLSDPLLVSEHIDDLYRLMTEPMDVLFCNEQEALVFTGESTISLAVKKLKTVAKVFHITCGADGSVFFDGTESHEVSGANIKAVNTNGAGDAFAAGYFIGCQRALSPLEATHFAHEVAGGVVAISGPRFDSREAIVF